MADLEPSDAVSASRFGRDAQMMLGVPALLFLARVLIQLIQRFATLSWLPGFEQWQSGSVPYSSLVLMQLAILGAMAAVLVTRRRVPQRWIVAVRNFGVLYFAAMLLRLVAGSTIARNHGFLDRPLPSIFHMVIASFVIMWATLADDARPHRP